MQYFPDGTHVVVPDSATAYAPYTRMKLSGTYTALTGPTVTAAGAGEDDFGVLLGIDPYGNTSPIMPQSVRLANAGGTVPMIASGAITAGNTVYPAASGKISATAAGKPIGIALASASGDGSVIEVMRFIFPKTRFSITRELLAASVDNFLWVADRAVTLVKASVITTVAGGAGSTLDIRKVTAAGVALAGAAAGATVVEMLATAIALDATAATTTFVGSLSAVAGALNMAIGDKLAINYTNAITGLVGVLTCDFIDQ